MNAARQLMQELQLEDDSEFCLAPITAAPSSRLRMLPQLDAVDPLISPEIAQPAARFLDYGLPVVWALAAGLSVVVGLLAVVS